MMRVEGERPLLSVVVAARNDDHGGGFLRRMQVFVNGLLEQAARFGLASELIIVEWNPPPDRPRLAEALRWPAAAGPCAVRIIEVPAAVHRRYAYSDKLALFQMIAKNVGVRRSRGRFVLCTNVDVLFSEELIRFFTSGGLDEGRMYRIDRFDVSSAVPLDATLDEQLQFCRRHIVRVNLRWRTLGADEIGWRGTLRRYRRMLVGVLRAVVHLFVRAMPLRIVWGRFLLRLRSLFQHRFMLLHTNACGDFTLLSRERWYRLRGYPEWAMYSFHLDSVGCYMAHYQGAHEIVLKGKNRMYHIDHRSGWSPEGADSLVHRMGLMGVPILDYEQLCSYVREMHERKSPPIFNDTNWGLVLEDLTETDPVTGQRRMAEVTPPVPQPIRA